MSQLRIVLFYNHLKEPIVQAPAFVRRQVVDLFDMIPYGKQAFPPGDGVGAHHRVNGTKGSTDIVWRPTRLCIELKSLFSSGNWESRLAEGGGQAFEESAVRGGDLVIDCAR
jgi:hypothetical protein